MDQLLESCERFAEYPANLIDQSLPGATTTAYASRLSRLAERLFVRDGHADLSIVDVDGRSGIQCRRISWLTELKHVLRESKVHGHDSQYRFVSIHAHRAHNGLSVSHDILCFLFTYLQVMPNFLNLLFKFSDRGSSYFTKFGETSVLDRLPTNHAIPELGRSGRVLRMCYKVASAEESPRQASSPWTIGQTAMYLEFDLETGRTLWILVEGNKSIQQQFSQLISQWTTKPADSPLAQFSASLTAHLLLCEWTSANWGWYIDDLEEQLLSLTDRMLTPLAHGAENSYSPLAKSGIYRWQRGQSSHLDIAPFDGTSRNSSSTSLPSTPRSYSPMTSVPMATLPLRFDGAPAFPGYDMRDREPSVVAQYFPLAQSPLAAVSDTLAQLRATNFWKSGKRDRLSLRQDLPLFSGVSNVQQNFEHGTLPTNTSTYLGKLQEFHRIEEQAYKLLLALKANVDVLEQMRQHYLKVSNHAALGTDIHAHCQRELTDFDKRIHCVREELDMARSRTDILVRLLHGRQQLLFNMLDHEMTRDIARQERKSADAMQKLAAKVERESAAMRVITLLTLLFLPGTFLSTFFGADIIQFEADRPGNLHFGGLKTYLVICIPLMVVTLLAWYLAYRSGHRKERLAKEEKPTGYHHYV